MPYREMTLSEVARYLHLSEEHVKELVRRGEIPFERKKNQLVFRRGEIDTWVSRRLLGGSGEKAEALHVQAYERAPSAELTTITGVLLKPTYIEPALTCKTKASLLREMVRVAERTGKVALPDELLKSISAREELCSTAMPEGIALLHPRTPDPYVVEESFVVLGRTIQAIPFGAPDGSLTDIFFLIYCREPELHLRVLARLCTMARKTGMIGALRGAPDARALYEVLVAAERDVCSLTSGRHRG